MMRKASSSPVPVSAFLAPPELECAAATRRLTDRLPAKAESASGPSHYS